MNKNIKKIVALTVALAAVATIVPATGESTLGVTNVYAEDAANQNTTNNTNQNATTNTNKKDENTNKELKSIELSDSNHTLKLYDSSSCKSSDKVDNDDVKEGNTYYAKTTKKKISVDVDSSMSKYVRIFDDDRKSTKGKKEGESISISSGTNTITVRVYKEEPSGTVKYEDDYLSQYKFKVKCQSSSKDKDDDDDDKDNDDIYLSDISLSEGNIDFSKKTSTYNVKVPLSTKEITIKARPEDDDDEDIKVTIDGSSVDEDDKWKRSVDLNEGKNKILIKVKDEDNDDKRTYTLNINRGNVEETSSSIYLDGLYLAGKQLTLSETQKAYNYVVSNETDEVEIKAEPKDSDYTVLIDGEKVKNDDSYTKKVKVKDDIVNSYNVVVKNSSGTEQTYTINVAHKNVPTSKFPVINNGTASNTTNNTTNTVTNNNSNNWVSLNGNWRFYDDKGNLATNTWIYDQKDGQTYYVDASGNMARGWLPIGNDWYYLGQDGAKKTGWQNDGQEWYYMDYTGKMLRNTDVGQYRVGPTGAWVH